MANSAFDHTAALSIPSSTTQYGLVTWDSNNGGGLLSSSVVLSTGGALSTLTSLVVDNLTIDGTSITTTASNNAINLTPHGTGAVVISKTSTPTLLLTNSGNSNAITLNTGTTAANYTITMPTAAPAAGKFLKTTDGSTTQLEWGDAAGGTTINNNADNRVITGSGTADTLEGEATLTFGSNALSFDNDHAGNNAINLINDENNASASTRLTIQTGHANGGDAVALFHAGGQSYIIGVDNSETNNSFKIAATGGNLGTNDRFIIDDGYVDIPTQDKGLKVRQVLNLYTPSNGGAPEIFWTEGDGTGSANNMKYRMAYNGTSNNYFSFRSYDTNGSSADDDIWRVYDGTAELRLNNNLGSNFDKYDDALVLERHFSDPYRAGQDLIQESQDELIEMGILVKDSDGWIGQSLNRWVPLLAGGVYQTRQRVDDLYEELKAEIKELKAEIDELKG